MVLLLTDPVTFAPFSFKISVNRSRVMASNSPVITNIIPVNTPNFSDGVSLGGAFCFLAGGGLRSYAGAFLVDYVPFSLGVGGFLALPPADDLKKSVGEISVLGFLATGDLLSLVSGSCLLSLFKGFLG